ncbi:hypothetical protein LCGC14_2634390, partial [marine sediment metagenome]
MGSLVGADLWSPAVYQNGITKV